MHLRPRSGFHFASRCAALILASMLAACGQWRPPINTDGAFSGAAAHSARNPASNYRLVYSFPNGSGSEPESSLTYVDGRFYGTTSRGGAYNGGTLFSFDSHGKLRILHDFNVRDGFNPTTGVTEFNGTLYGTTFYGGIGCGGSPPCGWGTLYSISPSGSNYKVIHFFTGAPPDGGHPGAYPSGADLIVLHGTLYGTTLGTVCPSRSCGTVFAVTPSGAFTTAYRFEGGIDGSAPEGVTAVHGTLYGTTKLGGTYTCPYGASCGSIFSLTTSGTKSTLHSFRGKDGYWPDAGLTVLNGRLYGTTSRGGVAESCVYFESKGCGTVFEASTSGEYRVLHRFEGQHGDGATPHAALLALNGTLYGTTVWGPSKSRKFAGGWGTAFSITPGGDEVTLHRFKGPPNDGGAPEARLTNHGGTLFGTSAGGASRHGVIFSITP
jgi:uncharacterized repeat protein (TIGR03803 family)